MILTMKAKTSATTGKLRTDLIRLSWIHFAYATLLAVQIIAFHGSKLITPELVLQRWQMTAGLFAVSVFVWYMARTKSNVHIHRWLVLSLIAIDIAMASFSVYTERGMSSVAVLLFVIPIIVSAVLRSRAAIFATAAACIAAYTLSAVKYFIDFFNEGYNVQLYGTIGFYTGMFLVVAALLVSVLHTKDNS